MPDLTRESKLARMNSELDKNITINQEQKNFWHENGPRLSPVALDCMIDEIVRSNEYVNACLDAAFKHDPDGKYSGMLKAREKKIEREAFRLEENSQQPDAESFIDDQLKNI